MSTLNQAALEKAYEAYWDAEGGTFKGIDAAIAAYLTETAAADVLASLEDVVGRLTTAFPATESYEPIQKARAAINAATVAIHTQRAVA